MSVLVIGLNHRSADLDLLERLAVPSEELPKALRAVTALEHVIEGVVLSTCNRVEVYAHVSRFHPGLQELVAWLSERAGMDIAEFEAAHYAHYDERAAEHLFTVASGLDSLVVGEPQIGLQVKQAAEVARDEGASRRVLQKLFREAVRVSRRARSETAIEAGARSMVDVGLDTVVEHVGPLVDKTVLVVGAGKVGALTAEKLSEVAAQRVLVWNRTPDKARRIAARADGEVIAEPDLHGAVADADVVVCTTGASHPILHAELVEAAIATRPDRPVVLLDLAVPRNVDPACAHIPGVEIVDIDVVREAIHEPAIAGDVVAEVRAIVEEEALRFGAWTRAVKIEPTIRALRERADAIRRAELERVRIAGLDERQREAVEALARGIINTLLHEPSVRLKSLADRGGAEHYANALRELFDLDE
ncbi:MAG: glutamyl-tRNA reductase [Actinobacteria bacterium]|nr:glutamyl-tRNA reductase [Actinomycetota bacterium]